MTQGHDVIVIGAGIGGLACAAELVLQGKRPLLISETNEVAVTVRSTEVGGCRGMVQQMWQGNKRHMFHLAQRLNINLRLWPGLGFGLMVEGRQDLVELPYCATPRAFAEFIEASFGFPSPSVRRDFEKALQAGFDLPREQLVKMHRVPVVEWLANLGVCEEAVGLLLWAFGTCGGLAPSEVAQHESVFGAFANVAILSGEAIVVIAQPNIREGWAIPVAEAIEARGGEIWRGRKVDHVVVENDRAAGVVLEDGTETFADVVAIATGDGRIPVLLKEIPDEIQVALDYNSQFDHQEFDLFTVLNKPVLSERRSRTYTGLMSATGDVLTWNMPLHASAPWTVPDGKQLIVSERLFSSKAEVELAGGEDQIEADIHKYNERLYPGYADAIEATRMIRHRQLWMIPLAVGPKMPRNPDGIDGLWFVSNSTSPIDEVYLEGAACAGIYGAREIVAASR